MISRKHIHVVFSGGKTLKAVPLVASPWRTEHNHIFIALSFSFEDRPKTKKGLDAFG